MNGSTPSASGGVVTNAEFQRVQGTCAHRRRRRREVPSASSSACTARARRGRAPRPQRAPQQRHEIRRRERLELENLRARDQRAVDVEERIVRRRADEAHRAALHIRQQHILLRLVEAVDFVDEQDRLRAAVLQPIRRRRDHAPHVGDVALHAAQPLKPRLRALRDDLRQRRLPRPRRAEKDDRGDAVRLDRAPQQFARAEDVLLPGVFLERARAHPFRERRFGGRGW